MNEDKSLRAQDKHRQDDRALPDLCFPPAVSPLRSSVIKPDSLL